MPLPVLIASGVLVGLISFVCLLVGVVDKKKNLTIGAIFGLIFVFILIFWANLADRPADETITLNPIRVDDTVIVMVDGIEPRNMTLVFGKDIDVEKYNIQMTRQIAGYGGGIYWYVEDEPRYKLVKKDQ